MTPTSIPYLAALVSVSEEVRCRCHLKYHNNNTINNNNFDIVNLNYNNNNQTNSLPNNSNMIKQSPSSSSLIDEQQINNNPNLIKTAASTTKTNSNNSNVKSTVQQPKRQRSCDIIDSRNLILSKANKQSQISQANNNQVKFSLALGTNNTNTTNQVNSSANSNNSNTTLSPISPNSSISQFNPITSINSSSSNLLNPYSYGVVAAMPSTSINNFNNKNTSGKSNLQHQQYSTNTSKSNILNESTAYQYQKMGTIGANQLNSKSNQNNTSNNSNNLNVAAVSAANGPLNVLLDSEVISDYPTQALLLTVLATLVRNSSDENEIRILYEYIAEASITFVKVFPVIHNLLDSKINHIIQLSLDESILNSVQSIIQNMISSCVEMSDSNQQQLSYLQSCGFGGLWRFAQPFSIGKEKPENVELFVDCLEAMVETCLPPDDDVFGGSDSASGFQSNLTNSNGVGTGVGAGNSSTSHSHLHNNQHSLNSLNMSVNNFMNRSNINLITGSMSSISMNSIHSPTDLLFDTSEYRANNRVRRNSSPKNLL